MAVPPQLAQTQRQRPRVARVAPCQHPATGWAGQHYCPPSTWASREVQAAGVVRHARGLQPKVDALTHQINDVMPLYVSFRRALHGHTTVWYEPLEEENVGHGGCHEVTGDVYKHTTASAQRHLSIERVGIKDSAFLATFGKGAIGHARSESRSTFVAKLMHVHLAMEARQEMWAGQAKGSITCGCGCVLGWTAPDEVSRLQWHMLECGGPRRARSGPASTPRCARHCPNGSSAATWSTASWPVGR